MAKGFYGRHYWFVIGMLGGCAVEQNTSRSGLYWKDHEQPPSEATTDRPPTPQTMCLMARVLAYQGRDSHAERVFTRVLSEYPKFMPVYCDLAELQVRLGRIDDARRTLALGLKVSPKDPVLLNNMGMCLMLDSRHDESLIYFLRARPGSAV